MPEMWSVSLLRTLYLGQPVTLTLGDLKSNLQMSFQGQLLYESMCLLKRETR